MTLEVRCSWYTKYKGSEEGTGMDLINFILLSETIPYDQDGINSIYHATSGEEQAVNILEVVYVIHKLVDIKNVKKIAGEGSIVLL